MVDDRIFNGDAIGIFSVNSIFPGEKQVAITDADLLRISHAERRIVAPCKTDIVKNKTA